MTTDQLIDDILRREGGYVNNPSDHGGPTNFGITIAALAHYRNVAVLTADIQALTMEEARNIYAEQYVAPFGDITNQPMKALVVDMAVNMGAYQATILLQRSLGVPVDGKLGPQTLAAANAATSCKPLTAQRMIFYSDRATADPGQRQFLPGWFNRALEFV